MTDMNESYRIIVALLGEIEETLDVLNSLLLDTATPAHQMNALISRAEKLEAAVDKYA